MVSALTTPTPSNHSKQKRNYHPTATADNNIANSVKPPGLSTNRKGRKKRKDKTRQEKKGNHPLVAPYLSTLVYHITHWNRKKGNQTEWVIQ
jgi:hypothetical protein